jgi:hypothetical protein
MWSRFLEYGRLLAFDVLLSKGLLADEELVFRQGSLLAFDVFFGPKVFWQTWSRLFGHGSLLVFDVLRSKGLLADVKPVF